jgi:peptidoglycan/LPS O-acetylase OafA/YrhL
MSRAGLATWWLDGPALAVADARGGRLEAIEALRGFAALLVVVGHALDDGIQFGVEPGIVPDWPIWNAGVDLFFVISGFIMVWTFGDRFGSRDAVRDFAVRRLSRIVPLYWLVTVITALVLLVWPSLFDRSTFDWSHLVLSLLFVPHYAPGGELLPMVGVGWTLNYEMFFYLVFALGLIFPTSKGLGFIVLTMVGSLVAARLIGSEAAPLARFLANPVMLDFVLGMALGLLVAQIGLNRPVLLATAAAALVAVLVLPDAVAKLRFAKVGLPALALVSTALAIYPRTNATVARNVVAFGAASYALYLFHPLVLNLTKAMLLALGSSLSAPPLLVFIGYTLLALMASLVIALLLRTYVEVPMLRLCRRVTGTGS